MSESIPQRVVIARAALAAGRVKSRVVVDLDEPDDNVVSLPSEVTADRLLHLAEQNLKAAKALTSAALELAKVENRKKK